MFFSTWLVPYTPTGFTTTFFIIILRVYICIKGIAGSILMYSMLPLYRSTFDVSGQTYQAYMAIIMTPWAMKPAFGAIIDTFPLFGYKKRWYTLLALFLGTTSSIFLTFNTSIFPTTFSLFLASFSVMLLDLLYEGEYSRIMAFEKGSIAMPTIVWSSIMSGSIIGAVFAGPLGDNGDIRYIYPIAALCFFQLGKSLLFSPSHSFAIDRILLKHPPKNKNLITNLLYSAPDDDDDNTTNPRNTQSLPTFTPKITTGEWILCLSMSLVAIIMIILLFTGINYPLSTLTITTILIFFLHTGAYYLFNASSHLWTYNLYLFLAEALYINIEGVQDFWFTAAPDCLPNGPAFSLTYYTTITSSASAIISILTTFFYHKKLTHFSFRWTMQFAILFQITSGITDIILAKRWNLLYLNISDELFFFLGDTILSPIASMLKTITMVILTSKIVQQDKETMTYSLLAGFQNLGLIYAKIAGIYFSHLFHIYTQAPYCNFTFYPALIFLSHMLIPFLSFILAFIMLPKLIINQ